VTVTSKVASVVGAVNKPDEEIVPALALQVTAEVKLPVPLTLAVHWLVAPEVTVVGEQLTLTEVMVEVFDPPPPLPQAAIHSTLDTANNKEIFRAMMSPLLSGYR
jgi:hypothetical protein